jgi:hypothetical protein
MSEKLDNLKMKRNMYIKFLWLIFKDMHRIQGFDEHNPKPLSHEMTDEDFNLWTSITNHSSIQKECHKKEG